MRTYVIIAALYVILIYAMIRPRLARNEERARKLAEQKKNLVKPDPEK